MAEDIRTFGLDDPLGPTGLTLRQIIPQDRPLVCDITGCSSSAFVFYPQGMLCRKHESELKELRRKGQCDG